MYSVTGDVTHCLETQINFNTIFSREKMLPNNCNRSNAERNLYPLIVNDNKRSTQQGMQNMK